GDDGATGSIEATLTQIPAGVLCVKVTVARGSKTTLFNVSPGQNSATLSVGALLLGTTSVEASAYNLACAAVTASTVPDWTGTPVSVDVQAGIKPQISLTLLPNTASTVGVNFVPRIVSVSRGGLFTLALTETGSVYAWGYNFSGELL